jgi:hypothetical protein
MIENTDRRGRRHKYRGADKPLARPTSLSIGSSIQGTSGSPMGPDPENRLGDQEIGAQVGQFLLGCKCPVIRFLPGRAKDLSAPCIYCMNVRKREETGT